MVTMGIDGISAIGKLRPQAVSYEFVMRGFWIVVKLFRVFGIRASDLLQKHHVCPDFTYCIPKLGQDELAVKKRKSLVNIDSQYLDAKAYGSGCNGFLRSGHYICIRAGGHRYGYDFTDTNKGFGYEHGQETLRKMKNITQYC